MQVIRQTVQNSNILKKGPCKTFLWTRKESTYQTGNPGYSGPTPRISKTILYIPVHGPGVSESCPENEEISIRFA
jgi:hypothetical protein